ncbi:hypothetical protein PHMEG_00011035 [Phytophthora megakarya]|uniref:Uncharacterized protein n=1 Tax=Phytophthora megakarya TaxID=4795 RepID=A0A225WC71_9STRA|nr:hypothetical protein PHMEG_00011035 [Phytophthora megakarya]
MDDTPFDVYPRCIGDQPELSMSATPKPHKGDVLVS